MKSNDVVVIIIFGYVIVGFLVGLGVMWFVCLWYGRDLLLIFFIIEDGLVELVWKNLGFVIESESF